MSRFRRRAKSDRRGMVMAYVGLTMVILMSFAALAMDLGYRWQIRTEMQAAADAAALAGAGALATEDGTPFLQRGRDAAIAYAAMHTSLNMGNQGLTLASSDVIFGDAVYNSGRWTFQTPASSNTPYGVRVILRRDGNNNPLVNYFFARAMNTPVPSWVETVTSTAMVAPRDIALVLDLSRSMSDDSLLVRRNAVQINLRDIWVTIEDVTNSPSTRTVPGAGVFPTNYVLGTETTSTYAAQNGRGFASMAVWGTNILRNQYNQTAVTNDLGMYYCPPGQAWNTATTLGTPGSPKYDWLVTNTANPFALNTRQTAAQITNILVPFNGGSETTTQYRNRVQVLLGFSNWNDANNNHLIEAAEMTSVVDEPYNLGAGWVEWIDYVRNGYDSNYFQYRYGLKAYINWLVDNCYGKAPGAAGSTGYTPRLQYTVIAKLQACKDAILGMSLALKGVSNAPESSDRVGLVVFGTGSAVDPYTTVNGLTSDFDRIADLPFPHQPGEIGPSTNTPEALLRAYIMLQGPGSRRFAHKMIVLMTDGEPTIYNHYTIVDPANPANKATLNNVTTVAQLQSLFGGFPSTNQTGSSGSATTETYNVAKVLTSGLLGLGGVEIVPVGVGSDADAASLQQIANLSRDALYLAVPDPNNPTAFASVLQQIFVKVASQRPVALIK